MRFFLISDNTDTPNTSLQFDINLFQLQDRTLVTWSEANFDEVLKNLGDINVTQLALAQPDIGMILVTEKIADDFTEIVNDAKKDQEGPLVLAIPDRHGSALGRDRITRYVREAIGVKI